jgi:hypothetical protein
MGQCVQTIEEAIVTIERERERLEGLQYKNSKRNPRSVYWVTINRV